MKILTVPQNTAILRTKSSLIQEVTPEVIKFLRELGDTLKNQHNPQGVGLSAIQVGRPIRAFATWLPKEGPRDKGQGLKEKKNNSRFTNNELRFYLNPEIIDHSPDTTLGEDLIQQSEKRKAKSETGSLDSPSPTLPRPELGTKAYPLNPKPFLEGCLSIPSIYGSVPRWSWIKARATVLSESDLLASNLSLIPYPLSLEKLASRVFQHELDHLNGVLFTDRTLEAGLTLYESKEKELVPMEM